MSVFVTIVLDTRRLKKKTNAYPVKLRVTFERKARYYLTRYDLTEEAYSKLNSSRLKNTEFEVSETLKDLQWEAEKSARDLDPFCFSEFEKDFVLNHPNLKQTKSLQNSIPLTTHTFDVAQYKDKFPIFKNEPPARGTILFVFLHYIDKLLREHRIVTATHYQTAYNTFARFRGNVKFTDITVAYLNEFEYWMLQDKYSITTIGIYTRCLRVMFNEADFMGIIKKDKCYPFGRKKYRLPISRNVKKALPLADVEKIFNYEPVCKQEKWAKDIWLFSYFGNGMNTKDIAHLKYQNIHDEFITFYRAKTLNATRDNARPISIFITAEMRGIIEYWGNQDKNPENYIFPILQPEITALRQYELLGLFIRSVNDWMAKIRKKLGIERKITTYVARHTFSTVLKRAGVSTEYIQEALGHTSMQTTENYLDSFEKDIKKEFASKLMAFKK